MATITVAEGRVTDEVVTATWAALDNTDGVGSAWQPKRYTDMTCQVLGTFDTGTIVLQGSNDGINWITLTDPAGTAISFTAAALVTVMEAPVYIRPSVSGATATDDITMIVSAIDG